jgi:Ca-activated chloride channel family protein
VTEAGARRSGLLRVVKELLPIGWTMVFAVPTAFVVGYLVENMFEVPLSDGSFRFERPWAALLLIGVPFVLVSRGFFRYATPRLRVSRGRTLSEVGSGWRVWLEDAPTGLRTVALTLAVFGLMGPQSVHSRSRTTVEGIDIVLCLDLSLSMQAGDIQPDRFTATKQVVDNFIRQRPNDRIGAVIFGSAAFTLLPLTSDKDILRSTIAELELGTIDGRGTAIGNGVATSLNRLRASTAKSKIIILLTDGESNAGDVSPETATEYASAMNVKVFTILMGQTGEAPVQQGIDLFQNPILGLRNLPVNPELLQRMADRTGGTYFNATDRQGLEGSFHRILDELEKTEMEDVGTIHGELFAAFMWPAFILLLFELALSAALFRRWP